MELWFQHSSYNCLAVSKVSERDQVESLDCETLKKLLQEVIGNEDTDNAKNNDIFQRDKDLEIVARIGEILLQRNESLESDLAKLAEQNFSLEQQVILSNLLPSLIVVVHHQLRQTQHTVTRKEELLRLYATEQEQEAPSLREGNKINPDWVQVLTEECKELRESNLLLQEEADKLRKDTADVELKERELVQQCLEQFSKWL